MSAGSPSTLAPAQLRRLRRLAAAGDVVVARRAGIVLAEHQRRTAVRRGTAVPPPARGGARGISTVAVARQTAAKWYARFVEDGAAGLQDMPRAGRPAAHGEESVRAVLVAPLFMSSVKWTSHTVAEVTGQSQTAVVRAWRQTYEAHVPGRLPSAGLALVAAAVADANSVLILAVRGVDVPSGTGSPSSFMRSPRRAPLQVLLAADLLADGAPQAGEDAAAAVSDGSLVDAALRRAGGTDGVFVLSRRPLSLDPSSMPGVEFMVVPSARQWQGLLETLVRRCTATAPSRLVGLQQRLMTWAQGERGPFEWLPEESVAARRDRWTASSGSVARPSGQLVAEAVLAEIMARIASGRLAARDRVTETSLSRAVHASRGHVRDALLTLASNGLVDLEPRRGARVPAPQVADVIETYAARRALGAIIVRRAVHWIPGALEAPEDALAALLATGESGDAWACGEADMRFQDALALSTRMRRIPQMFLALSAQIRLFTAVMGVRYTYSIPAMLADDTALLHHVRQRNEAAALGAWHAKIDDALDYMVTQLGPVAGGIRRSRSW
jgi:DNA-binding GntR family transcriptional regulator